MNNEFNVYQLRRKDIVNRIKEQHNTVSKGSVLLLGGFENDRQAFWQESSFLYYTGVTEPATALTINLDGKTTLYNPNCGDVRKQWVQSAIELTQESAKTLKVDEVRFLGDPCAGFQLFPFFKEQSYSTIIILLKAMVADGQTLFTLYPNNEHEYVEQRLVINRLCEFVPGLKDFIVDVSDIVADMRRSKDMEEIDLMVKAIEITELSHEAAAQAIEPGMVEREVQASLEYMMIGSGSRPAFPSIVATGKNATILHYTENGEHLKKNDLVVVDIGASYKGYCADISRTYPVSGTFTARQRELYDIVLAAQTYIADIAKSGMYLNNSEYPEKSLNHLAKAFFAKHNLDQYFIHGIGHYLGLDVHDVGSYKMPLRDNDVFTIEPGIYIPEEGIGIRIEDNYWIVKNGAVCLSENLPKTADKVEMMVQEGLSDDGNLGEEVVDFNDDDFDTEH